VCSPAHVRAPARLSDCLSLLPCCPAALCCCQWTDKPILLGRAVKEGEGFKYPNNWNSLSSKHCSLCFQEVSSGQGMPWPALCCALHAVHLAAACLVSSHLSNCPAVLQDIRTVRHPAVSQHSNHSVLLMGDNCVGAACLGMLCIATHAAHADAASLQGEWQVQDTSTKTQCATHDV
jgi:hypothetical protein